MNRGVVFLSSVFGGLEETRRQVFNLLRRLGYSVWWAEALNWPKKPPPEWTAAICLTGIDESDYYLGIYPSRYGSDPLGMGFTELEYHRAAGRRMPRFLYHLHNHITQPPKQSLNQRAFLNLLSDTDISSIHPLSSSTERQQHSAPILEPWNLFSRARGEMAVRKLWEHRMLELNRAKAVSLPAARMVGLAHLAESLNEFTPDSREFLDGFDDYLNNWIGISAWSGIRGIFGQTNLSKTRICLAQLRGHYGNISTLAGGVSSGLYSERKLHGAEKWYAVYRRSGEAPEIEGPIALALGNVNLACTCFETILARSNIDSAFAALNMGYYGHALASKKNFRRAIKESEKSIAVANLPATVGTRVWRARAETLFMCGDNIGAKYAIDEAEKTAFVASLDGQMEKARKVRKTFVNHSL
jgi:hypothetical protein